ncbi:hypothetical protein JCM11251_000869 [Rhodosporidiobolus azoricus]
MRSCTAPVHSTRPLSTSLATLSALLPPPPSPSGSSSRTPSSLLLRRQVRDARERGWFALGTFSREEGGRGREVRWEEVRALVEQFEEEEEEEEWEREMGEWVDGELRGLAEGWRREEEEGENGRMKEQGGKNGLPGGSTSVAGEPKALSNTFLSISSSRNPTSDDFLPPAPHPTHLRHSSAIETGRQSSATIAPAASSSATLKAPSQAESQPSGSAPSASTGFPGASSSSSIHPVVDAGAKLQRQSVRPPRDEASDPVFKRLPVTFLAGPLSPSGLSTAQRPHKTEEQRSTPEEDEPDGGSRDGEPDLAAFFPLPAANQALQASLEGDQGDRGAGEAGGSASSAVEKNPKMEVEPDFVQDSEGDGQGGLVSPSAERKGDEEFLAFDQEFGGGRFDFRQQLADDTDVEMDQLASSSSSPSHSGFEARSPPSPTCSAADPTSLPRHRASSAPAATPPRKGSKPQEKREEGRKLGATQRGKEAEEEKKKKGKGKGRGTTKADEKTKRLVGRAMPTVKKARAGKGKGKERALEPEEEGVDELEDSNEGVVAIAPRSAEEKGSTTASTAPAFAPGFAARLSKRKKPVAPLVPKMQVGEKGKAAAMRTMAEEAAVDAAACDSLDAMICGSGMESERRAGKFEPVERVDLDLPMKKQQPGREEEVGGEIERGYTSADDDDDSGDEEYESGKASKASTSRTSTSTTASSDNSKKTAPSSKRPAPTVKKVTAHPAATSPKTSKKRIPPTSSSSSSTSNTRVNHPSPSPSPAKKRRTSSRLAVPGGASKKQQQKKKKPAKGTKRQAPLNEGYEHVPPFSRDGSYCSGEGGEEEEEAKERAASQRGRDKDGPSSFAAAAADRDRQGSNIPRRFYLHKRFTDFTRHTPLVPLLDGTTERALREARELEKSWIRREEWTRRVEEEMRDGESGSE